MVEKNNHFRDVRKKVLFLALLTLSCSGHRSIKVEDRGISDWFKQNPASTLLDWHDPNGALTKSMIFSASIVDSARTEVMRIDMDLSRVVFGSRGSEIIYYVMADSGMVYIVTIKKIKPKQRRIEL